MKKNKIVLIVFFVSILYISSFYNISYANLSQSDDNQELSIAKHIRVVAKGMVCSFCAQGVKKGLESHDATVSVVFNQDYNLVDIQFKESNLIREIEIINIFNNAGYEVVKIINNPKE